MKYQTLKIAGAVVILVWVLVVVMLAVSDKPVRCYYLNADKESNGWATVYQIKADIDWYPDPVVFAHGNYKVRMEQYERLQEMGLTCK